MDNDINRKKVALIPGIGIGDSLLFVPSIYNLLQKGYELEVFSNALEGILPYDSRIVFSKTCDFESDLSDHLKKLKSCSLCFIQIDSPLLELKLKIPHLVVGRHKPESLPQGLLIERDICLALQLPQVNLEAMRTWLNFPRLPQEKPVIAIHPSSSHPSKNWPLQGFLKVARTLTQEGYRVVFCLASGELELAERIGRRFELWQGLSLHELTSRLATCQLLIGSDSGLGHLASLIGIPTLSIFQSKRHSLLWCPCWNKHQCVLPWIRLPRCLRDRLWKTCVSSFQVIRQAHQLLEKNDVRTSC